MTPELSIVICSFKNPHLLGLCIDSIKKNVVNIDYELIVADGQTGEETHDLMREKFPDITFLSNKENLGFGELVRQGLGAAKGEYFFVINVDIIIKDEAANILLKYLKQNPDVGIVGPKLVNFDNSVQNSCFRFYSPLTIVYRRTILGRFGFARKHLDCFLMKKEQEKGEPIEADWIMGSAMMTSRQAVEKVGVMDKRFFMYFEDVDWCWRFWKKGYKVVYNPTAKVFHYHGKQSASENVLSSMLLNKYSRIHISSAIKYFTKHFRQHNPRTGQKVLAENNN